MSSIELYESQDGQITLDVQLEDETVWLTQQQLATLYNRDVTTIRRHIKSALEEELEGIPTSAKFTLVQKEGERSVVRSVLHYNLDMVISVGYRVKSQRGVEFRRWATNVLKRYIVAGHVENEQRLKQLGQVAKIMSRIPEELETRQILDIVQTYTRAFELLDSYDHHCVPKIKTQNAIYKLSYDECIDVIDKFKSAQHSELFGVEKDDSFRSSIANIYQSFGGQEIYPSLEEKAANLLYLVVKNHSFLDGNKRIASMMFLYFLDRNDALFKDGKPVIDDNMLVAMALMIAESKPEEKDSMVALVMNFIA